MADVIIASAQTDDTKQSLIASMAQKEIAAAATFASHFTDVSKFAVKGMKQISFPKLTSFTVSERASGGTVDAQAIADSVDTLPLNIPAFLKWRIDPNDALQSTIDWELECVSRAGSAHGRYFDAKVRANVVANAKEVVSAGANTVSDITRNIILEMREYLKKNNADFSKVKLHVSANQMTALLKIAEFTNQYQYGSAVTENGLIGRVFGIPVIETNALNDGEYFMSESGALCYGFQKAPGVGYQDDIDLGVGAKKAVMDCLYGVASLQVSAGSAPTGKSALMIRWNDGV